MAADEHVAIESVPLAGVIAPGLPSYSEVLKRSGQHDAPPPPYSGYADTQVGSRTVNFKYSMQIY